MRVLIFLLCASLVQAADEKPVKPPAPPPDLPAQRETKKPAKEPEKVEPDNTPPTAKTYDEVKPALQKYLESHGYKNEGKGVYTIKGERWSIESDLALFQVEMFAEEIDPLALKEFVRNFFKGLLPTHDLHAMIGSITAARTVQVNQPKNKIYARSEYIPGDKVKFKSELGKANFSTSPLPSWCVTALWIDPADTK